MSLRGISQPAGSSGLPQDKPALTDSRQRARGRGQDEVPCPWAEGEGGRQISRTHGATQPSSPAEDGPRMGARHQRIGPATRGFWTVSAREL